MTENQIRNLYYFIYLYVGISDSIFNHSEDYLLEKFKYHIGIDLDKYDDHDGYKKSRTYKIWVSRWTDKWVEKEVPSILMSYLFESYENHTLDFSTMTNTFESYFGSIDNINGESTVIHKSFENHFNINILTLPNIKREISISGILK